MSNHETLLFSAARVDASGAARLLAELTEVRWCRLIVMAGRQGRPRMRIQIEEIDAARKTLAEVRGAAPAIS